MAVMLCSLDCLKDPGLKQPQEATDLPGFPTIITKTVSTVAAKRSSKCQLLELKHAFISTSVFGRVLKVFSSKLSLWKVEVYFVTFKIQLTF